MFAQPPACDTADRYDQLASRYDRLHSRWLRHAAAKLAALEALVRALFSPGKQFLDAGCGTGKLARALLSEGMTAETMTLLDPSEQMLAHCADLPVHKVAGRPEALPSTTVPSTSSPASGRSRRRQIPSSPCGSSAASCPGGVLCLAFARIAPRAVSATA